VPAPRSRDPRLLAYELGRAFAGHRQLPELITLAIASCRELLKAEGVAILLWDRESDELYFPYSVEEDPQVAAHLLDTRFPADQGIAGKVLRTGQSLRVDDVSAEPLFFRGVDQQTQRITRNLLCASLIAPQGAIGVIEAVNSCNRERFDDDDLALLNALAQTIADAIEHVRLRLANAELAEANQRLQIENVELKREARGRYQFEEIIGDSPALHTALRKLENALTSKVTVLLESETGTGKELFARALHFNGPRAEKPFVAKNCGAVSGELLYSELFGHKKGAFTGASEDRAGVFEHANGGTVFLDEIGECSATLQVGLLRVLENGEITRLGENTPRRVDVRIIAATNRDLRAEIKAGRFREDLYYRLSVFAITVPPLRERKEDIQLLAEHTIGRLRKSEGKRVLGLTPEALAALCIYDFPGNVRELQNELHRAFVMADDGGYITPDLLSDKFAIGREAAAAAAEGLPGMVERFEAQMIRQALANNDGNQTRAAEALRIGRRTLIDKLQKYGVR